ncbi:hypothetical protein BU17DRAFT_69719 [Hysterangium stoloniferum]|nr:hypothetical protein BU17DRAFT_69719 [Hysterangium stoloniferum]
MLKRRGVQVRIQRCSYESHRDFPVKSTGADETADAKGLAMATILFDGQRRFAVRIDSDRPLDGLCRVSFRTPTGITRDGIAEVTLSGRDTDIVNIGDSQVYRYTIDRGSNGGQFYPTRIGRSSGPDMGGVLVEISENGQEKPLQFIFNFEAIDKAKSESIAEGDSNFWVTHARRYAASQRSSTVPPSRADRMSMPPPPVPPRGRGRPRKQPYASPESSSRCRSQRAQSVLSADSYEPAKSDAEANSDDSSSSTIDVLDALDKLMEEISANVKQERSRAARMKAFYNAVKIAWGRSKSIQPVQRTLTQRKTRAGMAAVATSRSARRGSS